MNVLIIGGTRFMGPLLAWRLIARGDRVTLVNRGQTPDPFGDRVERLRADRHERDEMARALAGRTFDAAVDFLAYDERDIATAIDLLAGKVGHYVFISTGQVYLVREKCPRPAKEEDYDGKVMPRPTAPRDASQWDYGAGKRACEDALVRAFREARFPSTRIRIPMVNGELDHDRRIENYLWRLLDGGPLLLPDGGDVRVRHVYGDDVARTIASILGKPETFGRAFNLAQDETPTLADLVAQIARELGARTPDLVAVPRERIAAAGLDPVALSPFSVKWMSFIDPLRARLEIGFCSTPLPQQLGRIIASFRAHPPSDRPASYARRADELALARACRA